MGELEQLAKSFFEIYSSNTTGVKARWELLNDHRKYMWMQEAQLAVELVLINLKEKVKPVQSISPMNTSYSVGYIEGIKTERTEFITLLHQIQEDLTEELEEFEESIGQ